MIIFYIKMKIRAGGGRFRAAGGALGQQGAPPCYSSLWETLDKDPIYLHVTVDSENYDQNEMMLRLMYER